ncbi:hypothetical protein GCM10025857_11240 [Alicyclobacillus contaminans]|nr:hypothetical protein [Alicyclobacillus contaminans]GMA49767.1 hypothetical protein GCM10025857_11240 [Alicyclobacillus contaminans]
MRVGIKLKVWLAVSTVTSFALAALLPIWYVAQVLGKFGVTVSI